MNGRKGGKKTSSAGGDLSLLKVVTVIQTRTGSTRLPGKVLKPLGGKPSFVRMVERVKESLSAGEVVVATTVLPEDVIIERICDYEGIPCFRGHPTDLLDRHYEAARSFGADVVVKIPSDCPLIDPGVVDRVILYFLRHRRHYDYVSNLHPQTYPDGNDVEAMHMGVLETAWREASRGFEREHTTPFIWDNPGRFRIGNVAWELGLNYSMTYRWVLDYREDYDVISPVYEHLSRENPLFGIGDILRFLDDHPHIRSRNAGYLGTGWYMHHREELKTIG